MKNQEVVSNPRRRQLAIVAMLVMLLSIVAVVLGLVLSNTSSDNTEKEKSSNTNANNNDDDKQGNVPLSSSSPTISNVFGTPTTRSSQIPTMSLEPSTLPSLRPSVLPTISTSPTVQDSTTPSTEPTKSFQPTISQKEPSVIPSSTPSFHPTLQISSLPSLIPSTSPAPSPNPTSTPTQSSIPSLQPSSSPTTVPSLQPSSPPTLSLSPTIKASLSPTLSTLPTTSPSAEPSYQPTPFHLQTLLVNSGIALKGGQEFTDPTSYQSKALLWLENHDGNGENLDVSTLTVSQLSQRYALGCLYYATYNVTNPYHTPSSPEGGWTHTANWLDVKHHECDRTYPWMGVICHRTSEIVVRLDLRQFYLTGTVPPELGLFTSLQSLDLYDNPIYNANYEWLLPLKSTLEYLYYGSTYFISEEEGSDGAIPMEIGQLTKLKQYEAHQTLYSGALEGTTFQNLQQMEYLSLGGNDFRQSTIPTEILTLPKLKYLYVEDANISSSQGMGYLNDMVVQGQTTATLVDHWVHLNPDMGGTLDEVDWSLFSSTLQGLNVGGCNLRSTIPTEIGLLEVVTHLWLDSNNLVGTIPSQIGQLTNLKVFNITFGEALEGSVPQEVCNLRTAHELQVFEMDCSVECNCCTNTCP